MSRIVASYLVKVTLREPELFDAPPPGGDMFPPPEVRPTNEQLERLIREELVESLPQGYDVGVTSERTDV